MPDRPARIVGTVRRNSRESVRISLREKRGTTGFDLDVVAADPKGEQVPTGRGLRIPPERLGDLIEGLKAAQRLAISMGLIPSSPAGGGPRQE